MLSFELKAGAASAQEFLSSVKLCLLAENLGAVETLVTHPASMSHSDVPMETRDRLGITDKLIRLSIGLEDPEDIIAGRYACRSNQGDRDRRPLCAAPRGS